MGPDGFKPVEISEDCLGGLRVAIGRGEVHRAIIAQGAKPGMHFRSQGAGRGAGKGDCWP